MQNLQDIISDARFHVFGDSTNTQYSDTDIKRNINNWYRTVLSWIIEANGEWQVNGEETTTDLEAGQKEYILPTDLLKFNEIYFKINGEYKKGTLIDPQNIGVDPDDYQPVYPSYDLKDNSLFLYFSEDIVETEDGIKLHYQTDIVTELSANGDNPNITDNFRRLLAIGSAYDYCIANEMWNKSTKLERLIFEVYKPDLTKHYSKKNTKPTVLVPYKVNYR
jgi:hypothetical protein